VTTGKIGTVLSVGVYGHHHLYIHSHLARADVLMGYMGYLSSHGKRRRRSTT